MIRYSTLSRKGRRSNNEDALAVMEKPLGGCFVVADGLGGMDSGEIASRLACKTVIEEFECRRKEGFLENSIKKANEEVLREQKIQECVHGMKTTLAVLALWEGKAQWAHVGDTRLYLFKGSRLVKQTEDHSVPGMLVKAKKIQKADIRFHDDRNRLLRVLGESGRPLQPDISEVILLKDKMSFLICTDGFWEWIEENQMKDCLKAAEGPKEWLELMEKVILANGVGVDMDNYSAVAVWVRK